MYWIFVVIRRVPLHWPAIALSEPWPSVRDEGILHVRITLAASINFVPRARGTTVTMARSIINMLPLPCVVVRPLSHAAVVWIPRPWD